MVKIKKKCEVIKELMLNEDSISHFIFISSIH